MVGSREGVSGVSGEVVDILLHSGLMKVCVFFYKLVLTSSRQGKQEFCCSTEKGWKQRKNFLITFDIYLLLQLFLCLQ